MAGPRRTVVAATQLGGMPWQTRWKCTLGGCGHRVITSGRTVLADSELHMRVPAAPKTASCYVCERLADQRMGYRR